jgi:hypothetical protein
MATISKRPYGYQLRVSHKLLQKDLWATFDSREAAEQYGRQLEGLLAQGIVPAALLEREQSKSEIWTVHRCIAEYLRHNAVPVSEQKLLDTILPSVSRIGTGSLNYDWAEGWIRDMKRLAQLAPSTIRHRHGALARCFDWMTRKHPEIMAQNPLRLLKRGFATYTEADAQMLAVVGMSPRVDEERDRRLLPDEEARIAAYLADKPDELLLFELALQPQCACASVIRYTYPSSVYPSVRFSSIEQKMVHRVKCHFLRRLLRFCRAISRSTKTQ